MQQAVNIYISYISLFIRLLKCHYFDVQDVKHTRPGSLYYLTKLKPDSDRTFSQKFLEVIGGMLQQFMPQMINVRRILRARVPIVKFVNATVDVECDLCLENKYVSVMYLDSF